MQGERIESNSGLDARLRQIPSKRLEPVEKGREIYFKRVGKRLNRIKAWVSPSGFYTRHIGPGETATRRKVLLSLASGKTKLSDT